VADKVSPSFSVTSERVIRRSGNAYSVERIENLLLILRTLGRRTAYVMSLLGEGGDLANVLDGRLSREAEVSSRIQLGVKMGVAYLESN
jgi:hypothetical protein